MLRTYLVVCLGGLSEMEPSEVSSPRLTASDGTAMHSSQERLTASDGTDMHSSQERAAVSLFTLCASQEWYWGPLTPP